VKVKTHRGEPINEATDFRAEKDRLRRPRTGKKTTHLGKCGPYSNARSRSKKRIWKRGQHEYHQMEEKEPPESQAPFEIGIKSLHGDTWKNKKQWLEYILQKFHDTHTLPTQEYTHTDPVTSTKTTDFLIREPSFRQVITKYLWSSNTKPEDNDTSSK
jgi:hypothetical protein